MKRVFAFLIALTTTARADVTFQVPDHVALAHGWAVGGTHEKCGAYFPQFPQETFEVLPSDSASELRVVADGDVAMRVVGPDNAELCVTPTRDGRLPVPSKTGEYTVYLGTGHRGIAHPYALARVPDALVAQFSRRQTINAVRADTSQLRVEKAACGAIPLLSDINTVLVKDRAPPTTDRGPVKRALPAAIPVSDAMPDPIMVTGTAGGRTAASALHAGCGGFVPLIPQHVLDVREKRKLRLWVEQPGSTLVVVGGDESTHCSTTTARGDVLDFDAKAGQYEVYVSAPVATTGKGYTLSIATRLAGCADEDPLCRARRPGLMCGDPKDAVEAEELAYYFSARMRADAVEAGREARFSFKFGAFIDKGDDPTTRASEDILSAVVRLRAGKGLCTATLVNSPKGPGLLTAAHCIAAVTPTGVLVGFHRTATVETIGRTSLDAVMLSSKFVDCVKRRLTYDACMGERAPDVAFVPHAGLADRLRWPVCKTAPKSRKVDVFGYGLDRGRLPGQLLTARLTRTGRFAELETASNDSAQWVAEGDSGGPSTEASLSMKAAPLVCYVIAASSGSRADGVSSLLQPIWSVWSQLDAMSD